MIEALPEELEGIRASGLRRRIRTLGGTTGPHTLLEGRDVLVLCSNDYLGLASHPRVRGAAAAAAERWGAGSGGSPLISGSLPPHAELAERLARFKGTETALLFPTGYQTNVGVLQALAGPDDAVFSDALNHASIVDACRLSRGRVFVHRHADLNHLEELLRGARGFRRRVLVTDGVFSMDGDVAPLREWVGLAERFGAATVVDDAHGTGVLGARGRGSAEAEGVERRIDVQIGTLSKALGSAGGFAAGSRSTVELLTQRARSLIFSTGGTPAAAAAAAEALRLVDEEPERRTRLHENARILRDALRGEGIEVPDRPAPIVPVVLGAPGPTMEACEEILRRGVYVQGIRPPSVPEGTSRLRASVSAAHAPEEVRGAGAVIAQGILASVSVRAGRR